MKLNFPKIVRAVGLNEYADELADQKVFVWVNPPSKQLAELADVNKAYVEADEGASEAALDAYLEQLSIVLSQGEKDTHFSPAELKETIEKTGETDPLFWAWLQNRIINEINDHRLQRKKA